MKKSNAITGANINSIFPIAIIIVFFVLSLLSFVTPSMISSATIQSLGLPALILSIVTSTRLIGRNAWLLCEKDYDRYFSDFLNYKDWRDHLNSISITEKRGDEKYGATIADLQSKMNQHFQVALSISNLDKPIMLLEIAAITFFLLSAILRTSFIYLDEHILVLFTLTVMLMSAYFNTALAELVFSKLLAKAEKNEQMSANGEETLD